MDNLTKGELELYLYKFRKYLSGVSRYIRNQQIKDRPYKEGSKMQEFNNTAINESATDCKYFNECYLQVRNNGQCFSECEDFHPQPYKECDKE